MATTIKVLEANSATPATAVAALNAAIAAEQTARTPQPLNVQGYASGVAAGPLYTYSVIFQTNG